jgi:hypothetical protein
VSKIHAARTSIHHPSRPHISIVNAAIPLTCLPSLSVRTAILRRKEGGISEGTRTKETIDRGTKERTQKTTIDTIMKEARRRRGYAPLLLAVAAAMITSATI